MSQRTYQCYTPEFKEQALGLPSLGKPVADVAQELQKSAANCFKLGAARANARKAGAQNCEP